MLVKNWMSKTVVTNRRHFSLQPVKNPDTRLLRLSCQKVSHRHIIAINLAGYITCRFVPGLAHLLPV